MKRVLIFAALLIIIGIPSYGVYVVSVLNSQEVHITAIVPESNTVASATQIIENDGGGGAGTVGSNTASSHTEETEEDAVVSLSANGYAIPSGKVLIYVDGRAKEVWTVDAAGSFSGQIKLDKSGTHVFSFVAKNAGFSSPIRSYSLNVEAGQLYELSPILLPPVFAWSSAKTMDGWVLPGATLSLFIDDNFTESRTSDSSGWFSFGANDTNVSHSFYVTCNYFGESCGTSVVLTYTAPTATVENPIAETHSVGTPGVKINEETTAIVTQEIQEEIIASYLTVADFSGDGNVNYIDFGKMRNTFAKKIYDPTLDLDNDGLVTLRDFSILAHQWSPLTQ